jgi:hypothetical protein
MRDNPVMKSYGGQPHVYGCGKNRQRRCPSKQHDSANWPQLASSEREMRTVKLASKSSTFSRVSGRSSPRNWNSWTRRRNSRTLDSRRRRATIRAAQCGRRAVRGDVRLVIHQSPRPCQLPGARSEVACMRYTSLKTTRSLSWRPSCLRR